MDQLQQSHQQHSTGQASEQAQSEQLLPFRASRELFGNDLIPAHKDETACTETNLLLT
jgi:hypothetical protein